MLGGNRMNDSHSSMLARQVTHRAEEAYRQAVQRYAADRSSEALRVLQEAQKALTAVESLATGWCKEA
jgi:hypothetical protein